MLDAPHGDRHIREVVKGLRDAIHTEVEHAHHLAVLEAGLQAAVTLEFSTLPPYLTALWSVKDNQSFVADTIREVLQEEMLHMALACNMLSGIGGAPKIKDAVPQYPGKLPMKVHPELAIGLSGLTKPAIAAFMEIERPAHQGHFLALESATELKRAEAHEHDPEQEDFTIGEFYDSLLQSFHDANPVFTTDRQLTGPLAWFAVANLDDVTRAIDVIETQGEGSEGNPDAAVDSLAHYFRFAELYEGKRLTKDEASGKWSFTTPIEFDLENDVWPVGEAPEGGYDENSCPNDEARRLLHKFNSTYSHLIDLLDAAWRSEDGQASLWHAIDTMFSLEKYALPLMQIARPDGKHYGPDFRYIPETEREPMP
ncbi:MAG: ferritin-like protein [Rhodobacter sp.]|nr:ferritin-like protein [Rhodobacter sp.]